MVVPVELRVETMLRTFEKHGTYTPALAKYFNSLPAENGGAFAKYDVLEFNRAMAPMTDYSAKAPKGTMPVRKKVSIIPPTYKEAIEIPVEVLKQVRDVGKVTPSAQARISEAIRQVRMNMERRWDWLRASWLTVGMVLTSAGVAPSTTSAGADSVYLDTRYGLTSAPLAVDLGFTAAHTDGVVAASWATATTDIKGDLDAARKVIKQDAGVDARRVILNSTTMNYIYANTKYTKSEWYLRQQDEIGKLPIIWGYEWDVIDDQVPFDSLSMATDTGAAGMYNAIPDKVVILTTSDNSAAGRYMLECEPSDVRAEQGARGAFMWQDGDWQHPHVPEYGIEWTGTPIIQVPDATYVFQDVTSTS